MRTLMLAGEPFHEVSDETADKIMALVKADEPKKEVFYHVGQRFVGGDNIYTLTSVNLREVQMINHKGTSIWASRKKVENPSFITESEFKEICGSGTFTLIEDSK